jgi:outer membrane protein OmpA-like peptidoglycan-associated protein
MSIGLRRAEAAKAYLVEKGVAPERIQTVSKGKTEPLVPNSNEENRRKNRRVKIVIIE